MLSTLKKKGKEVRGRENDEVRCNKGKETSYVQKWVFIMIFWLPKVIKNKNERITNLKAYWIVSVWLLRRVSVVGNELQEFPVIAGGTTSMVQ